MKEVNIKYSPYFKKSDRISVELLDKINKSGFDVDTTTKIVINHIKSPFILADNIYDNAEANNEILEFGVIRVKSVTFTGGCMYIEYIKDTKADESMILHGNEEEGYNLFILD